MGTAISKAANGFGVVHGNTFAPPKKTIFSANCQKELGQIIVTEASTMSDIAVRIKDEEDEISNTIGWSDLEPGLLADIFKRLGAADYIRCLSVCASWGSIPEKTKNDCKPKKDRQLPWLLISTLQDKPVARCFHGLSCFHARQSKYTMHLPQIAHHHCIGSSQGFLISFDSSTKFCALNPLTGARFPLPPTATHPDILLYDEHLPNSPPHRIIPDDYTEVCLWYCKAVISPSLDTIAVVTDGTVTTEKHRGRSFCNLAFARAGDDSWTALLPPSTWRHQKTVTDFIFHKGCLYVLYLNGYLVVFNLENPAAPPLVSPRMGSSARGAFLTETPDGEDLLMLWINSSTRVSISKLTNMVVFRLDKNRLKWNQVQNIEDVALFFGGTYLSSLSTRKFSCLKSNCVYFTVDDNIKHVWIYDLDDGSMHPLSPDDDLEKLYWPSLIWFAPAF